MRSTIFCLILLLSVGALSQTTTKTKSKAKSKATTSASAADDKLIDTEKSLWQAWKDRDPKPFQAHLDPKVVIVYPDGAVTLDDFLKRLPTCDVKDFDLTDVKVTHLSPTLAAVTYHATAHGTCSGQPVPEHVVAGSVWEKRGAKWIGAFHQESVPPGTMGNMGDMH